MTQIPTKEKCIYCGATESVERFYNSGGSGTMRRRVEQSKAYACKDAVACLHRQNQTVAVRMMEDLVKRREP